MEIIERYKIKMETGTFKIVQSKYSFRSEEMYWFNNMHMFIDLQQVAVSSVICLDGPKPIWYHECNLPLIKFELR